LSKITLGVSILAPMSEAEINYGRRVAQGQNRLLPQEIYKHFGKPRPMNKTDTTPEKVRSAGGRYKFYPLNKQDTRYMTNEQSRERLNSPRTGFYDLWDQVPNRITVKDALETYHPAAAIASGSWNGVPDKALNRARQGFDIAGNVADTAWNISPNRTVVADNLAYPFEKAWESTPNLVRPFWDSAPNRTVVADNLVRPFENAWDSAPNRTVVADGALENVRRLFDAAPNSTVIAENVAYPFAIASAGVSKAFDDAASGVRRIASDWDVPDSPKKPILPTVSPPPWLPGFNVSGGSTIDSGNFSGSIGGGSNVSGGSTIDSGNFSGSIGGGSNVSGGSTIDSGNFSGSSTIGSGSSTIGSGSSSSSGSYDFTSYPKMLLVDALMSIFDEQELSNPALLMFVDVALQVAGAGEYMNFMSIIAGIYALRKLPTITAEDVWATLGYTPTTKSSQELIPHTLLKFPNGMKARTLYDGQYRRRNTGARRRNTGARRRNTGARRRNTRARRRD
jgi:hypothetical protein